MSFCLVSLKNSGNKTSLLVCKKTLVVMFHIIFCSCNRQLLKNPFFFSERYKGYVSYYSFKINLQEIKHIIIIFSGVSLLFIPILQYKTSMHMVHLFFFPPHKELLHHSVFCEIHKENVIYSYLIASSLTEAVWH